MKRLRYIVKRGKAAGTVLTPHLHKDRTFVVSLSRFERDYVRVKSEAELFGWVQKGYGVRMSNSGSAYRRAPSLIAASSLEAY